jgi:hypothetical protein
MTRANVDARVSRAYARMMAAKSEKWWQLWANSFHANWLARGAMRSVAEVREIERARANARS